MERRRAPRIAFKEKVNGTGFQSGHTAVKYRLDRLSVEDLPTDDGKTFFGTGNFSGGRFRIVRFRAKDIVIGHYQRVDAG